MRRRQFMELLCGVAAWPAAARGQVPTATKRIAILIGGADDDPETHARIASFREGLRELNWVEGRNVAFDIRWGAGNAERTKAYAKELVRLAPDVILGTNTPTMHALKEATTSIPIVFTGLADPVTDGIVSNLPKPEGNITGITSFDSAIAGKWLQLLKQVSPVVEHAAAIYNPDTAPYVIFLPVMETVAPQLGLKFNRAPVKDAAAVERTITDLSSTPGGGLIVMPDVFTSLHRKLMFDLAIRRRVPTICPLASFTAAGGLVSCGSNFESLFRQSASYVDRILRGERPRNLPVQEPIKYELIVNLKTAKAIALTVPPTLLAQANEVIE